MFNKLSMKKYQRNYNDDGNSVETDPSVNEQKILPHKKTADTLGTNSLKYSDDVFSVSLDENYEKTSQFGEENGTGNVIEMKQKRKKRRSCETISECDGDSLSERDTESYKFEKPIDRKNIKSLPLHLITAKQLEEAEELDLDSESPKKVEWQSFATLEKETIEEDIPKKSNEKVTAEIINKLDVDLPRPRTVEQVKNVKFFYVIILWLCLNNFHIGFNKSFASAF